MDPKSEYARAIAWCYKQGIFLGNGDGTFAPDRALSRQELAKVLCLWLENQGAEEPEGSGGEYLDRDQIAPWAVQWVDRLMAWGVLEGSEGRFNPAGRLTCAQTVTALMRASEILQGDGGAQVQA